MESRRYYIVENGKQTGPFSFSDLKLKNLKLDSLVWYEGLEKWRQAKSIEEFKELFVQPPPITEREEDVIIPPIPTDVNTHDYELASIGARFVGYFLVNIIVLALFFLLGGTIEDLMQSEGSIWDVFYAGIGGALINGIFYPFFSGNLGHKLMGLKVIHEKNGKPVNSILFGLIREFAKGVCGFFVIPIFWIFFTKKRQTLYDKMEKTLVVKSGN